MSGETEPASDRGGFTREQAPAHASPDASVHDSFSLKTACLILESFVSSFLIYSVLKSFVAFENSEQNSCKINGTWLRVKFIDVRSADVVRLFEAVPFSISLRVWRTRSISAIVCLIFSISVAFSREKKRKIGF